MLNIGINFYESLRNLRGPTEIAGHGDSIQPPQGHIAGQDTKLQTLTSDYTLGLANLHFINSILLPISGRIPEIDISNDRDGNIIISHSEEVNLEGTNRRVDFSYKIELTEGSKVEKVYGDLVKGKQAVLRIPRPNSFGWTPEQKAEIQKAWRSLTIADKKLDKRANNLTFAFEEYQREAIDRTVLELSTANCAFCVVGTGGGKTPMTLQTAMQLIGEREDEIGLFAVNNNIILARSEETVREMYGEKYACGQLYEGKDNYRDKKIVFTTPVSLDNKLDEVIDHLKTNGKRIGTVIIDEGHHSASDTIDKLIKKLKENNVKLNWNTKIIICTATEVRPDGKSVLDYADSRSACVYIPAHELIEAGFLTPIDYRAGDLDILGLCKGPVFEGTPAHERLGRAIRDTGRFAHYFNSYLNDTKDLLVTKSLIIAPTGGADDEGNDLASKLVNYYNNPNKGIDPGLDQFGQVDDNHKGKVVHTALLTSNEKNIDNGLYFDHVYNAWKYGAWQRCDEDGNIRKDGQFYFTYDYKGSKERTIYSLAEVERREMTLPPVPQAMIGKEIFDEGVDIPGVNYMQMIAKTSSIIKYQQRIGRGVRRAPNIFKEKLIIRDHGGNYRNIHLFRSLFDSISGKNKRELTATGGKIDDKEVSEIETSSNAFIDALHHFGFNFDCDVTESVINFFTHVPSMLAHAHKKYENINDSAKERLDAYIATTTEMTESTETTRAKGDLHKYLSEFVSKYNDSTDKQALINEVRKKLCPAFTNPISYPKDQAKEGKKIPVEASTKMVYERLKDLLVNDSSINPSGCFTEQVLESMFPEFKSSNSDVEFLLKNIKTIRTAVLGLKSNYALSKQMKLRSNKPTLREILSLDSEGTMTILEAMYRGSTPAPVSRYGEMSFLNLLISEMLDKVPELKDKGLTIEDFNLPNDQFIERIRACSIQFNLATKDTTQAVTNNLSTAVTNYCNAQNNTENLLTFLKSQALQELLEEDLTATQRLNIQKEISKILDNYNSKVPNFLTARDTEIQDVALDIGKRIGTYFSESCHDKKFIAIATPKNRISNDLQIAFIEKDASLPRSDQDLYFSFSRSEERKYLHLCVNSRVTPHIANKYYDSPDKEQFIKSFINLLRQVLDLYPDTILVLPFEINNNFLADVSNRLSKERIEHLKGVTNPDERTYRLSPQTLTDSLITSQLSNAPAPLDKIRQCTAFYQNGLDKKLSKTLEQISTLQSPTMGDHIQSLAKNLNAFFEGPSSRIEDYKNVDDICNIILKNGELRDDEIAMAYLISKQLINNIDLNTNFYRLYKAYNEKTRQSGIVNDEVSQGIITIAEEVFTGSDIRPSEVNEVVNTMRKGLPNSGISPTKIGAGNVTFYEAKSKGQTIYHTSNFCSKISSKKEPQQVSIQEVKDNLGENHKLCPHCCNYTEGRQYAWILKQEQSGS